MNKTILAICYASTTECFKNSQSFTQKNIYLGWCGTGLEKVGSLKLVFHGCLVMFYATLYAEVKRTTKPSKLKLLVYQCTILNVPTALYEEQAILFRNLKIENNSRFDFSQIIFRKHYT